MAEKTDARERRSHIMKESFDVMNSMIKAMQTAACGSLPRALGATLPPHVQEQIAGMARHQAPMLCALAEACPPATVALIEQQAKLLAPGLSMLETIERIVR